MIFGPDGNFEGYAERECGEHRTVGSHRAWCHDCGEWCYPSSPCIRCEVPQLRRLARIGAWVEAHPAAEWIEDEYIAASLTGEAVHEYRSEAIAAGDTA